MTEFNNIDENTLMPVLYLPHGGGPLPILGEPGHKDLINFLKSVPEVLPNPKAILMISAHWESHIVAISSSSHPKMIYDYGGFPPECYEYEYAATGNVALAHSVAELLRSHNIEYVLDDTRGYDHGTFVPLMMMYPNANIPVVQLSLLNSLDPAKHIELGQAIALLREQGVLIIGSGMSYHAHNGTFEHSVEFDDWLTETLVSSPAEATKTRLINWHSAPSARDCHRREEHLLPLHVCFGAAAAHTYHVQKVYSGLLFGKKISGFLWR
ncbi:DODA-type extradiol aromatic ring-opening family dioxygenase [Shewanella sp. A14]